MSNIVDFTREVCVLNWESAAHTWEQTAEAYRAGNKILADALRRRALAISSMARGTQEKLDQLKETREVSR